MSGVPRTRVQADPIGVQLDRRLTRSAPLGAQEHVHITGGLALEHIIDGARQFMSQDGESFAFVMLFLQACQRFLAWGIVPQEQHGRFGKGPLEMGVADFLARGPQMFASRFLRALDQATIRGEVLHPWEAVHGMAFVEQHETEDFANARHGLQQVQGVGIVWLRGGADGEFQRPEQLIIIGDQGQVDRDGLWHSSLVKALGDTLAVGFGGAFLAHLGQVLLPIRILYMGQQVRALAHQVGAAA